MTPLRKRSVLGLSIDGGGVLGCGPSLFLTALGVEFDAYAGTSVGGLLALLLAFKGLKTTDELFLSNVGRIFHSVPLYWKLDPTRPKWQSDGFESVTKSIFGDLKMSDAPMPVYIPVSDFKTGTLKVYDRSDSALVRDVCLQTAAAPTYFAPRESRYGDGGLIANNPSMVLATSLKNKGGVPFEQQRILSLATGGTYWTDPEVGGRMCELQWAAKLIHYMMQATVAYAAFQAREVLGDRYLRLDPGATEDVAMDDLKAISKWRALWQTLWVENQLVTRAFCALGKD